MHTVERSERLQDAVSTLTPGGHRAVLEHQQLAQGYAWGWQDRSADGVTDLDERLALRDSGNAYRFSQEYAIHAAHYEAGSASGRTNVPDAHKKWRAGLTDESEWLK